MAQFEGDDRALLADKRPIVANGKRYWAKTKVDCVTCSQPDRVLFVKQKLDDAWMLECPHCETVTPRKAEELRVLNLVEKAE